MPNKLPVFSYYIFIQSLMFFINISPTDHNKYYRLVYQYSTIMKATIKICKVGQFTESQRQLLKRVTNVLDEHDLSVRLQINMKKIKVIRNKEVA